MNEIRLTGSAEKNMSAQDLDRLRNMGSGDDLEMIRSPNLWANWPVLPVKRYAKGQTTGMPECGVLLDTESMGAGHTVYIVNMFLLGGADVGELLASVPKYSYADAEAMLADGWMVD